MMRQTILTFSIFGLLEIGTVISNPFGGDLEDFPVSHFCKSAAVKSRDCVMAPHWEDLVEDPPLPEREASRCSQGYTASCEA